MSTTAFKKVVEVVTREYLVNHHLYIEKILTNAAMAAAPVIAKEVQDGFARMLLSEAYFSREDFLDECLADIEARLRALQSQFPDHPGPALLAIADDIVRWQSKGGAA